ncbi:MAG: hypothetical protein JF603_10085 [Acidobacteria bacterium]|nr:hypothetical protein [Acidobacteriota bacterium]
MLVPSFFGETKVLHEFERWILAQVDRNGVIRVAVGPVMLVIAMIGSGLAVDSGPLRVIGALLLVVELFLLTLLLVRTVRDLRFLVDRRTDTVRRLADALGRLNAAKKHRFLEWAEVIEIADQGDTTVTRRVKFEVVQGELHWLETGMSMYRAEPMSDRERAQVSVAAFSLDDDVLGARCDASHIWTQEDGRSRLGIQVYLPEPVAGGCRGGIEVRFSWPGYSRGLVSGGHEDFDWVFKPETDRVDVCVQFDGKVTKRFKEPRVTARAGCPQPTRTESGTGALALQAEYINVSPDRTIGFQVDFSST